MKQFEIVYVNNACYLIEELMRMFYRHYHHHQHLEYNDIDCFHSKIRLVVRCKSMDFMKLLLHQVKLDDYFVNLVEFLHYVTRKK
jgi:hypothetical protein